MKLLFLLFITVCTFGQTQKSIKEEVPGSILKCRYCKKGFDKELASHEKTCTSKPASAAKVTTNADFSAYCPYCSKAFENTEMTAHQKACDKKPKTLSAKLENSNGKTDVAAKNGGSIFKCQKCKTEFNSGADLVGHVKTCRVEVQKPKGQ